eukprot:jgi/Mesvir1/24487/Mv26599-RA.1
MRTPYTPERPLAPPPQGPCQGWAGLTRPGEGGASPRKEMPHPWMGAWPWGGGGGGVGGRLCPETGDLQVGSASEGHHPPSYSGQPLPGVVSATFGPGSSSAGGPLSVASQGSHLSSSSAHSNALSQARGAPSDPFALSPSRNATSSASRSPSAQPPAAAAQGSLVPGPLLATSSAPPSLAAAHRASGALGPLGTINSTSMTSSTISPFGSNSMTSSGGTVHPTGGVGGGAATDLATPSSLQSPNPGSYARAGAGAGSLATAAPTSPFPSLSLDIFRGGPPASSSSALSSSAAAGSYAGQAEGSGGPGLAPSGGMPPPSSGSLGLSSLTLPQRAPSTSTSNVAGGVSGAGPDGRYGGGLVSGLGGSGSGVGLFPSGSRGGGDGFAGALARGGGQDVLASAPFGSDRGSERGSERGGSGGLVARAWVRLVLPSMARRW